MAFMLWQRLANQNQLSEVGEHLESTSKMLSSVSQELKSRDAKEAVERLQNTMQDAQRRALMHVFNRWSCVSASLHENEKVTLAKDKEREATITDLQSKHDQRMKEKRRFIDRREGTARAGDGGEEGNGGRDGGIEA